MLRHHRLDGVEALKDMTKPVIFLFNGPAGSGKDHITRLITSEYRWAKPIKFADVIKKTMAFVYGIEEFALADSSKELKAQPNEAFFGQTCRQVQINFSELFMKPTHGPAVFGQYAAREIQKGVDAGYEIFSVSDSGFREEAEVLVDKFGADRIILFRLEREGCTFTGDSRSYISLADLGVLEYDISNNGTSEELFDKIKAITNDFILAKKGAPL